MMPMPWQKRLVVLTYHRVHESPDPFNQGDVDAATFEWQLRTLRRYFNVLRLDHAMERVRAGRALPACCVALTFDDGYRDNATLALPLLRKYGIPATFFVATATIDGGIMWNDRIIEAMRRTHNTSLDLSRHGLGIVSVAGEKERLATLGQLIGKLKYAEAEERAILAQDVVDNAGVNLPTDLMMCSEQVLELSQAGMEIGAHTHTHPIMCKLTPEQLRTEIAKSREMLEAITGNTVVGFAYPNGRAGVDYAERERNLVANSGFRYAMSTDWGHISARSDPYALPRISPWGEFPLKWAARVGLAYLQ